MRLKHHALGALALCYAVCSMMQLEHAADEAPDRLIKGYEHHCCEYGMSCYSGYISDEIKYEKLTVVYSYYSITII